MFILPADVLVVIVIRRTTRSKAEPIATVECKLLIFYNAGKMLTRFTGDWTTKQKNLKAGKLL